MKKKSSVLLFICLFICYMGLQSSSNGRATDDNAGSTGAPTEGTCTGCHNSNLYGTVSVSIGVFNVGTSNSITSYVPGRTYDIKVAISNTSGTPAGWGFQMTTLTTPGNVPLSGYSNLAANVKQKTITTGAFAGRTYTEHNGVSTSNQFAFQWTAPAAGTGSVKMYAGGNAVNHNGNKSGDKGASGSITIPEALPVSVSGIATDGSCNGASNGAITLTISNGTAPFSFSWNDGISTQNRTALPPGNYSVTVTDGVSATATSSFTITQPTALTANSSAGTITCFGASAAVTVSASGGTAPYTGTGTFTRGAGNQSFIITDAHGCTATTSVNIAQPSQLSVAASAGTITCAGATTSVNVSANGGTLPYSGTGIFTRSAGNQSFIVTDANGCTVTATVNITEPASLSANATAGNILCNGGTTLVTVTASRGTAPYTGTGIFTSGVGNQSFTVFDAHGCSAIASVNITQPPVLVATAGNDTINCTGGMAQVLVTANGGTPPYTGAGTFTESSAGIYNYPVTDNNGCISTATSTVTSSTGLTAGAQLTNASCNAMCDGAIVVTVNGDQTPFSFAWNTGATSQNLSDLCAGSYSQTIMDAAGCQLTNNFTITQPESLRTSIQFSEIQCFGNSTNVIVSASGGTTPYTGTGNFTVYAGNQNLIVSDAKGCVSDSSVTITQPAMFMVNINPGIIHCAGETASVTVNAGGGTLPYSGTGVFTEAAGNHFYLVTDAKGCTADTSIMINEPAILSASATADILLCSGSSTNVEVVSNGGTAPYSGAGIFTENAGTHYYTVTDDVGCTASTSVTINEPDALSIAVVKVTNADSSNDGSIDINVSGGAPDYTFTWSNGASTEDNNQLGGGSYSVTVVDANDCAVIEEDITVPFADGIKTLETIDAQLYSNPAENILTIEVKNADFSELSIYNVNGLMVMGKGLGNPVNGKYTLDISSLPSSIYIVELNSGARRWFSKFVKL